MQAGTNKIGECAYCGAIGAVTRDHVPPKGLFSEPRSNDINLITVPACQRCHNVETSMDDEYFRLALQMREGTGDHPDAVKARPTLMRSLEKPYKVGIRKGLLENIFPAEFFTPSGIFIKKQLALQTDMVRLRRVVQRTLNGLFYHHTNRRLPVGYDALVFNEESLQKWPAPVLDYHKKYVLKPLLDQKPFSLGNGVFSYRFRFDPTDPNTSSWFFVFYEHAWFLGLTVMPDKNI
jgi:hypothetical protein